MEPLPLSEIARLLGVESFIDDLVTDVVIDSRQASSGSLFVALAGQRVDGHRFVPDVLAEGGFALVREGYGSDPRLLEVADPLDALQQLATGYLQRLSIPVVGVTGSNGKTTSKDLTAAVLSDRFRVHKTKGNYNTEIGLPLTVLALQSEHQVLVAEMGMRGLGQIQALTQIAPPTIAVITNIGPVHLELLGSQERIAEAKGEILDGMTAEGTAVLNGDDHWVRSVAHRCRGKTLFYGCGAHNSLRATEISVDGLGRPMFRVQYSGSERSVCLPIPGTHNVYNALAGLGVGLAMGLSLTECIGGLVRVESSPMRMELHNGPRNIRVLNDTYNASPASMQAALDTVAALDTTGRRVLVLGDMLELGDLAIEAHHTLGQRAASVGQYLVFVGTFAEEFRRGAEEAGFPKENIRLFANNQAAAAHVADALLSNDVVLVKASRGMALEVVVHAVVGGTEG